MSAVKPAKTRIWEIDALRGFMILCMIVVHTLFAVSMFSESFSLPSWLETAFGQAGSLFVILSGLSATLGTRSFRRGALVFCCGLLLTAGSVIAAKLGILDESMIIRFGVLHCLGFCMMVWPLLRGFHPGVLMVIGIFAVLIGLVFSSVTVKTGWLYALGLCARGFSSGDYFPVFPQLGWFLLGGALGKIVYPEKKTLLPDVNPDILPLRFLRFCGRHTLWIFLPHLPVIYGILMLIDLIAKK